MPGASGIDVLAELRSDSCTAGIPVIMLTARNQASEREQAVASGARAYLTKPFSPLELIQIVDTLLEAGT